jgi:hypothetical protein
MLPKLDKKYPLLQMLNAKWAWRGRKIRQRNRIRRHEECGWKSEERRHKERWKKGKT